MKKLMNQQEIRERLLQDLPKYFIDTDVVDFREEAIQKDNNITEVGIALILKDGLHITLILSSLYNVYKKTGDENLMTVYCKELREKYSSIIPTAVKELQQKYASSCLGERICCAVVDTQKNKEMLSTAIFEEQGPFSIVLKQFIIDSNGYVMMAAVDKEDIEQDESLCKLSLHTLIETALINTSNHFNIQSTPMAEILADQAVKQMVEDGVMPNRQVQDVTYQMLLKQYSLELPNSYLLNNGTPYGAILMFYPGYLAEVCKKIKTNTLTIIPRTIDKVYIEAGKRDGTDFSGLIDIIDSIHGSDDPGYILTDKAFIYDATSDTLLF